jgi:hypothetical protein
MADHPLAAVLEATGWIRAMEQGKESGGSEPHLFATKDGQFMVKANNNPQMTGEGKIIVNELVGGLCLDWLGVAHPHPAVVNVSQAVIDDSPGAKFNNGSRFGSGQSFGSEYWQSDPQGAVPADLLTNKDTIAGTLVFDTWVRQGDSRQYRVRKSASDEGMYDFIPVDQGHSFGPNWTSPVLDADRTIVLGTPAVSVTSREVQPHIQRLGGFNVEHATFVVNQIPEPWITAVEREALKNYLIARAAPAAEALAAQYPAEGGAKA